MIVYPPHYPANMSVNPDNRTIPVLFLAGPIQGAWAWQERVLNLLKRDPRVTHSNLAVACPKRPESRPEGEDPHAQIDWESHWLARAGGSGCIMFWLAKEETVITGRAYAQTTRFEIGEWAAKAEWLGANIVVGIEPGFTGEKYIRRRLIGVTAVHSTLRQTLAHALDRCGF